MPRFFIPTRKGRTALCREHVAVRYMTVTISAVNATFLTVRIGVK